MVVLMVLEKIHLDSLPMPEDDVELRVRGIWIYVSATFIAVSSAIVFITSFFLQHLTALLKKYF